SIPRTVRKPVIAAVAVPEFLGHWISLLSLSMRGRPGAWQRYHSKASIRRPGRGSGVTSAREARPETGVGCRIL
ncbi:MAG: hypothetical protein R3224_01900, partial [Balneolaceae bacterium]|nr:hypothetical protein [Balneolaceae bacterium]